MRTKSDQRQARRGLWRPFPKIRPRFGRHAGVAALLLCVLLCGLVSLAFALEGPVLPPPGGVTITQDPQCTDWNLDPDECIGRDGGMDLVFTGMALSQVAILYWGPEDATAIGLALDCYIDEGGETMLFSPGQSNLSGGMARWLGTTELTYWNDVTWVTDSLDTRFTLLTFDISGPVPMTLGDTLGLGDIAVAQVPGDFRANLLMEAYFGGNWYSAIWLFDALHTRPEEEWCAISNFDHGFFYDDVPVTGLSATNDGPTMLGHATTLSATISTGTNVAYSWDFGDTHSGSGAVVAHTYAGPGDYLATVTATNSTGSVGTSTLVEVRIYNFLPVVLKAYP